MWNQKQYGREAQTIQWSKHMSYLHYVCLFAHSGGQYILTIWITWQVSYKRDRNCLPITSAYVHPLFLDRSVLVIFLVFCLVFCFYLGWVHSLFLARSVLLIFLVFCLVFCFVCLLPVSCVSNVDSFFELSLLGCPFGYL